MRVVAIGTSNSVRKRGLMHALGTDARFAFTNASIGASGTVMLAKRLDDIDAGQFDVALLDYAVNEENFLKQHESDLATIVNNLRQAIDRLSRAGCVPVLVLMPHMAHVLGEAPATDAILATFHDLALPVFDVREALRRAHALTGAPVRAFYDDPNHLKRPVARAVGAALAEALAQLALAPRDAVTVTATSYEPSPICRSIASCPARAR